MTRTKIEWSDYSWNPVTGCSKVSEGCRFCFARRMAGRLAGRCGYPEAPHHFDVTLHPDRLDQPLHWKKPRMIFVCSMSDLFHKDVPDNFRDRIFDVMAATPQHTYQVLTKRPKEMNLFLNHHYYAYTLTKPLPNVWLGISIENQGAADKRREYLRSVSAAVKFVSYEPALGPVDWTGWEFVNQIISGGESGPKARPSHPDWHRATRDFCQEHGTAYFFKQFGAWTPHPPDYEKQERCQATILPEGNQWMWRVGKKAAGHLLDGKEWREFPDVPQA